MKTKVLPTVLGLAAFGTAVGGVGLFVVSSRAAIAAPKVIRWEKSLDGALKQSKKTGRPVFVDFYATWCGPCKMLDKYTFTDPRIIAESQKWHMVKIDTDKDFKTSAKYGISSLPTLGVINPSGKPVLGTIGFVDADNFLRFLKDGKKKLAEKPKKSR